MYIILYYIYYINSLRKDNVGVSTLSSGDKQVIDNDSFEKAEILNNQFHSVLTTENLSDIPTPESLYPSMPDIQYHFLLKVYLNYFVN